MPLKPGWTCQGNGCGIIYLIDHADEITVGAAKKARHAGFLFKPFEPYQLKQTIDEALKQVDVFLPQINSFNKLNPCELLPQGSILQAAVKMVIILQMSFDCVCFI